MLATWGCCGMNKGMTETNVEEVAERLRHHLEEAMRGMGESEEGYP